MRRKKTDTVRWYQVMSLIGLHTLVAGFLFSELAIADVGAPFECRLSETGRANSPEIEVILEDGDAKIVDLADKIHSLKLINYDGNMSAAVLGPNARREVTMRFLGSYGALDIASLGLRVDCWKHQNPEILSHEHEGLDNEKYA